MKIKITITNGDIETLANALKSLDGVYEDRIIPVDGQTRVERKLVTPYKFKGGRLKYNIAKNLRVLNEAAKPLKAAHDKIVNDLRPSPEATKLEGKEYNDYVRQYNEVLEMPIELELHEIAIPESEVESNNIPSLVLAGLGEIFTMTEDQPESNVVELPKK